MPSPLISLLALIPSTSFGLDFDDGLHAALARAGDVDGDGRCDVLVMDRVTGGPLVILSGRDGKCLRTLEPAAPNWLWGRSLACAGDVNGDGVADQLAGGFGAVRVYSGRDGAVLHELRPPVADLGFGFHVAGEGELDGDGVPDLLVVSDALRIEQNHLTQRKWGESPSLSRPGRVHLYSGRTGKPLGYSLPLDQEADLSVVTYVPPCKDGWTEPADATATPYSVPAAALVLGRAAAFLPDIDGDGRSEIAVVCHEPTKSRVFLDLRSGVSGARLRAFGTTYWEGNCEGWLVGSCSDLDGDEVADPYFAVMNQGLIAFSGKDSHVVLQTDDCGGNLFSDLSSVAALGDVNQDARGDIAIAANEVGFDDDSGYWKVVSSTGAVLHSESLNGLRSGCEVAAAGDLDGDKVPDLVVLEHTRRRVRALSGKTFAALWEFDFNAPRVAPPAEK
jgi:hypothetical protein